uniref:Helicase ARIP4-like n=1 Tax=Crassostrea virginica TaxID=6565 RepID=A0A8B8E4S7_CRAVI|nr:helicase ARIP4-like [Crassostrea virginica]
MDEPTNYLTAKNSLGQTDVVKMTDILDQKKSLMDQLLTDEEEDDEEEDVNEEEEEEEEESDEEDGSEEENEDSEDSEQSENEEMDEESKGSSSLETDDITVEKTTDDLESTKVKATEEPTQADDENSNVGAVQPPSRKRKRKRGTGEKGKKKKSKKQKPTTLRRNIRDIFAENDLDKQTLDAQQEEAERRKRILEVQKALEEQRKKEKEENDSQLKSLLQMDDEDKSSDVIYLDSSDEGRQRRKSKDGDVIELSSDEDDVLLTKDEDSDVDPEDPNNAGNHINDALNIHDDFGRVLVNIGHPSDEPDIFLAPQIARYIKKHQIGGVRFLYDNLIESLSRFHNSPGFGCILAHSMGLGKTIQMISFVDVFLRCAKARTVLLIVPINTLQNWMAEFNMWCPAPEMVGDLGADHVIPRPFSVFLLNDNYKSTGSRAKVIGEWYSKGGVLLMGYEMYRLLSSRKGHMADVKVRKKKTSASPMVIDVDEEDKNKELLVGVHEALISPGPDLIVCDEGHRIKNSSAGISQSLKNIKTRRRVVLTGYPLQNNLMEYWCMVDFVRPNYLGTKTEFSNMFERPITNGQCQDSTPSDVKLMRYRAHVLHSLLEGFVQRRGHTVLQQALPPKQEYIFLVRMSPIQRTLYREFMSSLQVQNLGSWASTNPLKAFAVCCKIWNHPDILYNLIQKKKSITDDNDLDIETENGTGNKKKKCVKKKAPKSPQPVDQFYPPFERGQEISYEWVSDLLKDYTAGLLESGGKMVLLFKILEEALAIEDKILVFSQSLFTLDLLEEFLCKRKVPRPDMNENWCKNQSYFRLDGSTSAQEREKLINQFNSPDNNRAWLFLLSTRAGSLGVNLVGANRVVVLDASWNPCHDCQAICRVFRFGQVKPSYIYRLVTDNSMEKKIYDRQVSKQGMSNRVIDEMQIQNHLTKRQVDSLLHFEDKDPEYLDFSGEDYEDPIMNKLMASEGHWLTTKPFEHESLLIDKKELRLTKKEKRLAQQSYVMEKRLNVSYSRPSYAAFYPKGQEGPARQIKIVSPPSQPVWPSTTYTSRPVASVKPMITTPVPMQPKSILRGDNRNLPVVSKNKPGVSVHKVLTTTDIMLPGTATSTQSTAGTSTNKIPAGQQIFIIKTPKGVYIRTNSGKIFAVRAKFPLSGATTVVSSSPSPLPTATNTSTTQALTTADLLASSEENSDSQGDSQTNPSSPKDSDPSDLLASLYRQSDQNKPTIPRNDSSASLASQFGRSDMLSDDARLMGKPNEARGDSATDKQIENFSEKSDSMDKPPEHLVSKEIPSRKTPRGKNPSQKASKPGSGSQRGGNSSSASSNLVSHTDFASNMSDQVSENSSVSQQMVSSSSRLNQMDDDSNQMSSILDQMGGNLDMSNQMGGDSDLSNQIGGNMDMLNQMSGNSNMSNHIGESPKMQNHTSGNFNMSHQMESNTDFSNHMDNGSNSMSQMDFGSSLSNRLGGNSNMSNQMNGGPGQMQGSYNMDGSSNHMGNNSNMSNQMGGNSAMPSHMGNNSNMPLYPMHGGMGPPHMPYLFQNQLMYPQGGGYPPMSGMGSMPYSSPMTSSPEVVTSSSVPASLPSPSGSMSSMQGMPSMPMMGFPFAPYPFPMPQPYLMPGMDPNYMSQMTMPGAQRYNMHPGMHMPGSGHMMPPEYMGGKDYMNPGSSDCQSNQSLDMRHQDNSNM